MLNPSTLRPNTPSKRRWWGKYGGLIIVAVGAAAWTYLLLVNSVSLKELSVLPLAIIIGGFTVASAFIYTIAYRIGANDGITVRNVLFAFVIGGGAASFIAYTLGGVLNTASGGTPGHESLLSASLVGPTEEFLKGIAIVLIGRTIAIKSPLNGMLVGGAVGFGYSAFENLGYGMRALLGDFGNPGVGSLISNTLGREFTGPFCHPIWSSLLGAALFAAWGSGRFRFRWSIVGAFVAVALLHSCWDATGRWYGILAHDTARANAVQLFAAVAVALVGLTAWRITTLWARKTSKLLPAEVNRAAR